MADLVLGRREPAMVLFEQYGGGGGFVCRGRSALVAPLDHLQAIAFNADDVMSPDLVQAEIDRV